MLTSELHKTVSRALLSPRRCIQTRPTILSGALPFSRRTPRVGGKKTKVIKVIFAGGSCLYRLFSLYYAAVVRARPLNSSLRDNNAQQPPWRGRTFLRGRFPRRFILCAVHPAITTPYYNNVHLLCIYARAPTINVKFRPTRATARPAECLRKPAVADRPDPKRRYKAVLGAYTYESYREYRLQAAKQNILRNTPEGHSARPRSKLPHTPARPPANRPPLVADNYSGNFLRHCFRDFGDLAQWIFRIYRVFFSSSDVHVFSHMRSIVFPGFELWITFR